MDGQKTQHTEAALCHTPVLLDEVLEYLRPKPGGFYLDGTLGPGGHSHALFEVTKGKAFVLGLDRDARALELAKKRLASFEGQMHYAQCRFSQFLSVLKELEWDFLDGVVLDIGVSSLQLDTPDRGFSFLKNGPLDMRMGQADGLAPAGNIVNTASLERLKQIIGRFGEEPFGGRIARAIVEAREKKVIESTLELAAIIEQAYPPLARTRARNHPATKTFQALRMVVNKELEELTDFLKEILPVLRPGARVAVISFHSLEDRIVKQFFKKESSGCLCPKHIPVCMCHHKAMIQILTKKPLCAKHSEVVKNPRARSAKMRVAEKLDVSL